MIQRGRDDEPFPQEYPSNNKDGKGEEEEEEYFDAFVRIGFPVPIDLDAIIILPQQPPQEEPQQRQPQNMDTLQQEKHYHEHATTLRDELQRTLGLAYSEFVAQGCDVGQHRAFRDAEAFPPQIIDPPPLPLPPRPETFPTRAPNTVSMPTVEPSERPSVEPSESPSASFGPSLAPTSLPSSSVPSIWPSDAPSQEPSVSAFPSSLPTPEWFCAECQCCQNEKPQQEPQQRMEDGGGPQRRERRRLSENEQDHPTANAALTDFVVVQLRLKRRRRDIYGNNITSSSAAAAFEAPGTNRTTQQEANHLFFNMYEFGEYHHYFCDSYNLRDASTLFLSQCVVPSSLQQESPPLDNTYLESSSTSNLLYDDGGGTVFAIQSEACGCARDSCYCPSNDDDITPLTQDQFQTVLESFLPLGSTTTVEPALQQQQQQQQPDVDTAGNGQLLLRQLEETADDTKPSLPLSDLHQQQRRKLDIITSITQVAELEEFDACQQQKTVQVRVVHLINQDPHTLDTQVLQNFSDSLTSIVNSANLNNCDTSFRQITNSTLDISENPIGRRRQRRRTRQLNGSDDDEFYSYVWTVTFVTSDPDNVNLYDEADQSSTRFLAGGNDDNDAEGNILVDPATGGRRCFCPKYSTFPGRSISFDEYQTQVQDLIAAGQVIPGADSVEAIVELEQRTCGGDGLTVSGKSTVLVQLTVAANALSTSSREELERACLRAYNQQNSLLACDEQQYRITACSLSPLYPTLPNLVNGTEPGGNSQDTATESRFDIEFSCVGCVASASPFVNQENPGRRRQQQQQQLLAFERDVVAEWHRDLVEDGDNAMCYCPRGLAAEPGGDRPTVEEFIINLNVTGELGSAEDALEAKEQECKDGVVLFVTITLDISGDLSKLTDTEQAEFESVFRHSVNRLSVELCDPNYIYAFTTSLRVEGNLTPPVNDDQEGGPQDGEGTANSNNNEALMDIGYVCYGPECTVGTSGTTSLFAENPGRRVLSVTPLNEVRAHVTNAREDADAAATAINSLLRPALDPEAQRRLLDEVVVPISPCLCDRKTEGNTDITQEAFNERLNQEIEKRGGALSSIQGAQATGFDYQRSASPSPLLLPLTALFVLSGLPMLISLLV